MSSRTLTTLFNTYKLREEINELAEKIENDGFDEQEMEHIEKSLLKLRNEFEHLNQPSS